MTPNELLQSLSALPDDAPLVFETDAGTIGTGYHVTELKLSRITSIDCGARVAEWSEAALQLLDGDGGSHMPVGKFSAIVRQSIHRLSELEECPMHVEFAHRNTGLRVYQPGGPVLRGDAVFVSLKEERAHCKPALEMAAVAAGSGCCGSDASARCCQ